MASAGWSILQVLEKTSKNLDEVVYVHPMVKKSSSALSTKSLEMCTESLGSETGSDVISESGSDDFCVISVEERERLRAIQRSKYRCFDRKVRRNVDFPPPLTSISGSHCSVKVRQHREGGRLVMKAVSVSNSGTNFETERTNGRLKLSLLRDRFVNYESKRDEMEGFEELKDRSVIYGTGKVEMANNEEGGEVAVDVNVVVAEDEAVDNGNGGGWRWDMDGNRWQMAGKREVKMVTRCKEGGNGNKVFTNWRSSSWVAIS